MVYSRLTVNSIAEGQAALVPPYVGELIPTDVPTLAPVSTTSYASYIICWKPK